MLIVDDDPAVRTKLEMGLRRLGVRAMTAGNGADALHLLRYWSPDLIITDLSIPRMDGASFIRHAQEAWPRRTVPFIVHSGGGDDVLESHVRLRDVYVSPKSTGVKPTVLLAAKLLGIGKASASTR